MDCEHFVRRQEYQMQHRAPKYSAETHQRIKVETLKLPKAERASAKNGSDEKLLCGRRVGNPRRSPAEHDA